MAFQTRPGRASLVSSAIHRIDHRAGRTALALCALLGSTALTPAFAQTACTWSGAVSNGAVNNWTTAGNWAGCGGAYPNNGGGNSYTATNAGGSINLDNGTAITIDSFTNSSGALQIDTTGNGGSVLSLTGDLTNDTFSVFSADIGIGNGGMSQASTVNVGGNLINPGNISLTGGNTSAATATLAVTGAAPSTLGGQYTLTGNTGGAALQFGSGGITTLGDSGSGEYLLLDGRNAVVQSGGVAGNSALTGLSTIAGSTHLDLRDGAVVTTDTGLTVDAVTNHGQGLQVDQFGGGGGSQMTIGGNLTNNSFGLFSAGIGVGNANMVTADKLTVDGTATNNGNIQIIGGNTAGALAQMVVTGAAPSTLGGQYALIGNAGGAALQFGSGGITTLGDSGGNEYLQLDGNNAVVQSGGVAGNSALTGLSTIAGSSHLDLRDGAVVTTDTGLTVDALTNGGQGLQVDQFGGAGGSQMTIGGNLTNNSFGDFSAGVGVGNGNMGTADKLTVDGTATNNGNIQIRGGNTAGALAQMVVTGAAPSTLGGQYQLTGNTGGATLQFGSGGITTLGDSGSNEYLVLDGNNALIQSGGVAGNSALTGLSTIAGSSYLDLRDGATVTTTTGLTVNAGGRGLQVDQFGGGGGSQVTIGGNLTNNSFGNFSSGVGVGNGNMGTADKLTVDGTVANSGNIQIVGGNTASALAQMVVTGAVPSTLGGQYELTGSTGGAALQFGSGGITTLGDSGSGEYLILDGKNALVQSGGVAGNSALTGLSTIASSSYLDLRDGATVTTTTGLTVNAGGRGLQVDQFGGGGGSQMTIGGNLTNNSFGSFSSGVGVGNGNMGTADKLTVDGALANNGNIQIVGGNTASALAQMVVTGAVPSTLGGQYQLTGNTGGAALQFGSGGITTLGDSGSNEFLVLDGKNALVQTGGVAGNSALTGLSTIAGSSYLDLRDGATVTTTTGLTVNAGGRGLQVDQFGGGGGSQVTIGGNLTNNSFGAFSSGVGVGNGNMGTADKLTVDGALANNGNLTLTGGNTTGATAQLLAIGGVINTASVEIGTNGIVSVGPGATYAQTAGTTTVDGTLNGAVANTGGTLQGNGTINGVVTNAASLAGGDQTTRNQPGTLTIDGGYVNQSAGTLATLLQGTASGQASSVAVGSGAVTLAGGTIAVTTNNGFSLAAGQSFTPLTFGSRSLTGEFAALTANGNTGNGTSVALGNGLTLEASYNDTAGNVTLQVINTPTTTADTWNGGTGNFSTASAWSNGVPAPVSDVTIGATGSGAVTLNQDATVNSLAINAGNALTYQAGTPQTLTAGQNVIVNTGGTLSMPTAGDKLAVGQEFDNNGTANIGAGAVYGLGAAYNGGTMTLAGGSVTAATIDNADAESVLSGYGTLTTTNGSQITNSGQITATGGTLVATQGIESTGNITIASSSGLDLSHATTGSTVATLTDSGALALGTNNITVSSDYNNTGAGTGNAYNNHAGVTGTGQILAAGNTGLSVTGADITGGTLALGNVHVGSTNTTGFDINNTGTTGPSLRGAVQNAGITNAAIGVTAQNYGPIAVGGSQAESLTYDPHAAGALTGQSFKVVTNFDNVAPQSVAVTGSAYNYANPTVQTTTPVNVGNFHVGSAPAQTAVSISNGVISNATYQEGLDASAGNATGAATTNGGSFTLLAAGANNNSAITVGVNGTTAGVETGTVALNLTSDGANTSHLGTTALPQQIISVTGTGYNLAQSSTIGPINLGVLHTGSGTVSQAISITNTAATGSYTEGLDSKFGTYTNGTGTLNPTFTGSFTNLAAGSSSNALTVAVNTATAGTINGNISVLQDSNGTIDGLGNTALPTQNPLVSGQVTGTITNLAQPTINNAPISFGNVRIGSTVATQGVSVTNSAPVSAFSEGLIGNVTGTTGTGITASGGFGPPGTNPELAAGQTNTSAIQVGLNTATAGAQSGNAVIDFKSDGTAFQGGTITDLGNTSVAVSGNVYRLASPTLNTSSINLAARVGDTAPTAAISVTNSSPDQYTEALKASFGTVSSPFTGSGTVAPLAAGATNASSLALALNTATSGSFSGKAALNFVSTGAGTDNAADVSVGTGNVLITGKVFQTAVASVTPSVNFGIVHVGQSVAAQAVTVANTASGALTDVITGGFGTPVAASPFSTSGTLGNGVAAGTSSNALQVALDTSKSGMFTSTSGLALNSHDASLSDLALTTGPVSLSAQVNNYAIAAFGKSGGAGLFGGSGGNFTLNFGSLVKGSATVDSALFTFNAATGLSDLLKGSYSIGSGSGDFGLTGFNSFSGLGAGQTLAQQIAFDPTAVGSFSETIDLAALGYNASGYSETLPATLTIEGMVTSGTVPVPEPGSLALLLTGLLSLFGIRRLTVRKPASTYDRKEVVA